MKTSELKIKVHLINEDCTPQKLLNFNNHEINIQSIWDGKCDDQ